MTLSCPVSILRLVIWVTITNSPRVRTITLGDSFTATCIGCVKLAVSDTSIGAAVQVYLVLSCYLISIPNSPLGSYFKWNLYCPKSIFLVSLDIAAHILILSIPFLWNSPNSILARVYDDSAVFAEKNFIYLHAKEARSLNWTLVIQILLFCFCVSITLHYYACLYWTDLVLIPCAYHHKPHQVWMIS